MKQPNRELVTLPCDDCAADVTRQAAIMPGLPWICPACRYARKRKAYAEQRKASQELCPRCGGFMCARSTMCRACAAQDAKENLRGFRIRKTPPLADCYPLRNAEDRRDWDPQRAAFIDSLLALRRA